MIKINQIINVPFEISESAYIEIVGEYDGNETNTVSFPGSKFIRTEEKCYIARSYDMMERKAFGSEFHVKQSELDLWLNLG